MGPLGRLSERHWKLIARLTPIPCVDVVVVKNSKILMGMRGIDPYRNVWALPGGRVLKHEYPEETAKRVVRAIGLRVKKRSFVGVFPVKFPRHELKHYDIALCYTSEWLAGEPRSDRELVRLSWFSPKKLPARTGENYRKMIRKAFYENS